MKTVCNWFIALIVLLVFLPGCASSNVQTDSNLEPTATYVEEEQEIYPTVQPLSETIMQAYPSWLETVEKDYGYILDAKDFISDYSIEDADYLCELYRTFHPVIPSPVEDCEPYFEEEVPLRLSDFVWRNYGYIHEVDWGHVPGMDVAFDGVLEWRTHASIPMILDNPTATFAVISCSNTYVAFFRHAIAVDLIVDGVNYQKIILPSLGSIEYNGMLFRLPDECLNQEDSTFLADRYEWHPEINAKKVSGEQFLKEVGNFATITITRVFSGDGIVLVTANNNEYALSGPAFAIDIDFPVRWNSAEANDNLPQTVKLMTKNVDPETTFCLTSRKVPEGITTLVNLSDLENHQVTAKVYSFCYDYLFVFKDGTYAWVDRYEGGGAYPAYKSNLPAYVSGYVHYEPESYMSELVFSNKPRDLEKDAEAVRLMKQFVDEANADFYSGPIAACLALPTRWTSIDPPVSSEHIEDICGVKLTVDERYMLNPLKYYVEHFYISTLPYEKAKDITSGFVFKTLEGYTFEVLEKACALDQSGFGLTVSLTQGDTTDYICVPVGTNVWYVGGQKNVFSLPANSFQTSYYAQVWKLVLPPSDK